MRKKQPSNDGGEEEDKVDFASHKRKRRETMSPLSHLITSCRDDWNHRSPTGRVYQCSTERLVRAELCSYVDCLTHILTTR